VETPPLELHTVLSWKEIMWSCKWDGGECSGNRIML